MRVCESSCVVQQECCGFRSYLEDSSFPFDPVRSCEPGVLLLLFYDFFISSFLLSTLNVIISDIICHLPVDAVVRNSSLFF